MLAQLSSYPLWDSFVVLQIVLSSNKWNYVQFYLSTSIQYFPFLFPNSLPAGRLHTAVLEQHGYSMTPPPLHFEAGWEG